MRKNLDPLILPEIGLIKPSHATVPLTVARDPKR
jgi:hypothetical protein